MAAPATAMIQKVLRNLSVLKIAAVQNGDTIVADGLTISFVDFAVQPPMGGIDSSISPFLGIGSGAPRTWKLKGGSGMNSIAAIFANADAVQIFALLAHMANDIVVEAGDTTAELVRVMGNQDVQSVGQ